MNSGTDEKMDKEIKITLVATGFANAGMFGQMEDEEVTKLLRSLKVEEELDVPSFMRKSREVNLTLLAAVALTMVAASIPGRSVVRNAGIIQRAHPRFVENLRALGAELEWQ